MFEVASGETKVSQNPKERPAFEFKNRGKLFHQMKADIWSLSHISQCVAIFDRTRIPR